MEPILQNIPEEILTNRLRIRAPKIGDSALITPAVIESAKELAPWMPWANPTPAQETTEIWVRKAVASFATRDQFHYLLFDKATNEYRGTCGLFNINWKTPALEIGYWLRTSKCKHGLMQEAVTALTNFAFTNLRCQRIEIRCDQENTPSRRVAERAGYMLEGILRNHERVNENKLRNTCIYARIA